MTRYIGRNWIFGLRTTTTVLPKTIYNIITILLNKLCVLHCTVYTILQSPIKYIIYLQLFQNLSWAGMIIEQNLQSTDHSRCHYRIIIAQYPKSQSNFTPKKGHEKGPRRCWATTQSTCHICPSSKQFLTIPPPFFIEFTPNPLYLDKGLNSSLFCVDKSTCYLEPLLYSPCQIEQGLVLFF